MGEKLFKLLIIRHGQGFHNLGIYGRNDLEFTEDETLKTMNSSLTPQGFKQARLVSERLQNIKFDLAIASDLKRAKQTAEAVVELNDSLNYFEEWKIVRERCVGDFEGREEIDAALITVENAVVDRNYLTWRPPNGESVVDLRERIKHFLKKLHLRVMLLPVEVPTILVVSHGAFMRELYYILSEAKSAHVVFHQGPKNFQNYPKYHNTGLTQYLFRSVKLEDGSCVIKDVHCEILSCAFHLKNEDCTYQCCMGGCCEN